VAAGERITYVVSVQNLGPSVATNVRVTDTLPAGTTFATATGACSESSGTVICSAATLAAGAAVSYTMVVTASPALPTGASLENRVTVASATADLDSTNNSADADTSIVGQAALRISKSGPATAVAGEVVTYTVTITNSGPSNARFVDVKDQLPGGLTLQSVSASGGGACAGTLCQFGTVAAGASRTVTVVARVGSDVTGVVTNTAAVDSIDNVAALPVTAVATTTVTASAGLSVTKVALNDPASAGGVAFYQVVVHNAGPSDAQNVVVTDTLPVSTTFAGGDAACSAVARTVTCALGTLAAGATRTLLVQAQVDGLAADGLTLTNMVTATSPTAGGPVTAVVTSTVRQPAGGPVDLSIVKSGPVTATAGQFIVYRLVVANRGPATATAASLVDALPDGVHFVAASNPRGLCDSGVTCLLGDLPAGVSATVVITGLVAPGVVSGTVIYNQAEIFSSNVDVDPANNRATSDGAIVEDLAWLTIEKEATPPTVPPGGQIIYRIVVRNYGPSVARSVTVSDLLPSEVLFPLISSSESGCTGLPCNLGDLPPGSSATILIVGQTSPAAFGFITNTTELTTLARLHAASVISDLVVTPIGATADIGASKVASDTVVAGELLTYTLTVFNAGPSPATNVQAVDTLPAGTLFARASAACSVAGQMVTCATAVLAANEGISFTVVITTDGNLNAGTQLVNRVVAGSELPDPDPLDNLDQTVTVVLGKADLGVLKYAEPYTVTAGQNVTFTIVVSNAGPSQAQNIQLDDILPTGVTLAGPIGFQRSQSNEPVVCSGFSCVWGTVLVNEFITFTAVAQVSAGLNHNTIHTNTVSVYSPSDPYLFNNFAQAPILVEREARIVLTKVADPIRATAGEPLLYRIIVLNLGPSNADNVVVDDLFPAEFSVEAVASTSGLCTALPCTLTVMEPGDQERIEVLGRVAGSALGSITNTAVVTAATPLHPLSVLTAAVASPINIVADLEIRLDSSPTASAGLTATLRARVVNHGPSLAINPSVWITLPAGTTLLSAEVPNGWNVLPPVNNVVQITTAQVLTAGAEAPFVLTVAVDAAIQPGTSLETQASTSSETPDINLVNNAASSDTSIIALADLAIFKSGPAVVMAGDQATYLVTATNLGPSVASVRDLKEILPPGLTLESAHLERANAQVALCSGGICQLNAPLAVGEVVTMTVVAQVDPNLTAGSVVTNVAGIFPENSSPDPVEGNNTAFWPSVVAAQASLHVEKIDLNDPVGPNDLLVYAIFISNTGPSVARNVVITDLLPANTVVYRSTLPPCSQVDAQTLACWIGDLAPGARQQIQVVVQVRPDVQNGVVFTNVVTVGATTPLTQSILTADEPTRVLVSSGPLADLAIAKWTEQHSVLTGQMVTYTLAITNQGPSPVFHAQVVDLLPDGLKLAAVATSAGPGRCNAGVTCLIGFLDYRADANGVAILQGTALITVVAVAEQSLTEGELLRNTAFVDGEREESNPANNYAEATVTARTLTDLRIVKSALPSVVTAGQQLLYTLQVFNDGPSIARNTVVSDVLPAGVTLVSATGCTVDGGAIVCNLGDMAVNAVERVNILVTVDPAAAGVLNNVAQVASSTAEVTMTNNSSAIATPVEQVADVRILKRDASGVSTAGETITWTLTILNDGPSVAHDVWVADPLPATVRYLGAEPAPTAGSVTAPAWLLGTLAPGASRLITVVVQSDHSAEAGLVIRNTAVVSSITADPNLGNNSATELSQVFGRADLEVIKQAWSPWAEPGQLIPYTITVVNHGPSAASDVDVKDLVPPGLNLAGMTTSQGACVNAICQLGAVGVSETVVITALATLADGIAPGTALTNTAVLFTDTPDPAPDNNQDGETVVAGPIAFLRLQKSTAVVTITPNSFVTYTFVVDNLGPDIAQRVVLTDLMPEGFEFVQTTHPAGCAMAAELVLVCPIGRMTVNQRIRFDVGFNVHGVDSNFVVNAAMVEDPGSFDPGGMHEDTATTPGIMGPPTAVTLEYFQALARNDKVVLSWATVDEIYTFGFRLLRNTTSDPAGATVVTPVLIPGAGSGGQGYQFIDEQIQIGVRYWYWLQEVAYDGAAFLYGPVEVVANHGAIDNPVDGQYRVFLPAVSK
jgi:uncharacterized repeat protein (TIGR01451 family)